MILVCCIVVLDSQRRGYTDRFQEGAVWRGHQEALRTYARERQDELEYLNSDLLDIPRRKVDRSCYDAMF
jgi:hypothetical protein